MIIFLAILLPILYLLREFKIQKWRRDGCDTKTVISASSIFALPVFIACLIYILSSGTYFTFNNTWLIYSVVWLVACFVTNVMSYKILKYISVTQFGTLSRAISLFFSVFADIFIFHLSFPFFSVIAIFLMLIGGITIDKPKDNKKIPTGKTLIYLILFILLIRFLDIFQTSSFKQLAIIQENPLFFVAFLQTALFFPLSLIGIRGIKKAVQAKIIKTKDMIYLGFLILLICFAEPYVYKELPLTIITALALLRIGISYIYDIKLDNLKLNKKSLIASLLIIIGSIILVFIY
jgi:hypothetical protein